MYINYNTKEVVKTVTVEAVESFVIDLRIPVQEVRDIVERNFTTRNSFNDTYSGFMKINAIKELRDTHFGIYHLSIGLREAKEMIEAVFNEGIEAGNYNPNTPTPSNNHMATADTLPF